MDQKLNVYSVALLFEGRLVTNCVLTNCPEMATAMVTNLAMQQLPQLKALTGVAVTMVDPDFLRTALRSIETGLKPGEAAPVMALVPREQPIGDQLPAQPVWRTDGACTAHNTFLCGVCANEAAPPAIQWPAHQPHYRPDEPPAAE